MTQAERFERHSRTFSLLTFASRVTGLARDAVLSRVFGAGPLMDAFFFAFIVPNLFRRLFGEGAMAAAFLPEYARLDRDDPSTARRLATLAVAALLVVLGVVTLVGEALLALLADRVTHDDFALRLAMVMLPYMPLVCVVAILGAMLQVHGRFGPTAAAPIILNFCLIGAAVGAPSLVPGLGDRGHVAAMAAAVVAAGVLQLGWVIWALRAHRWIEWSPRAASAPARRVLRQALPMILGLGVLQLNVLVDGLIASYPTTFGPTIFGVEYPLETGAMASVTFAQRLYQFPLGVFGLAVATAIFPALSRAVHDDDAYADLVRRGLRLVVFIGLPASAGLMLVGEPLATVILEGGTFRADDSHRVARVLLGYGSAVWAYSMIHVLTRAFYARGDARGPMRIALWVVGVNLALNCVLIWTPLREAGLAWSTAICAALQVALLLWSLRRHALDVVERSVWTSWARSAIATTVMTGVVLGVAAAMPEAESWTGALVTLCVSVGAGIAAVGVLAITQRMPELRWAVRGKE